LNPSAKLQPALQRMLHDLENDIAAIEEDRRLEPDLRFLLERIHRQAWNLYE
jgi:histidine ammonia-lyase